MSISISTDRGQVYKTSITIPFLIAFLSLRHIFHELHEFAHMIAGRILCGSWGTRDFNNVHPITANCETSNVVAILTGLAGPMINYVAIWIGAAMIRTAKNTGGISIGLSLIFCSLPVARLITALFGGGDEMGVARVLITDPLLARLVVIGLICSILFYPLWLAAKTLRQQVNGGWYFVAFLFVPMFIEGLVVLLFFNYLLQLGIGTTPAFFGAPVLVIIVLVAACLAFFIFRKHLLSFFCTIPQPVTELSKTAFIVEPRRP